tara:strand:- start:269 stop:475 length:207 start_codon:yes stop_codon:yes gene_type:complete
MNNYEAPYGIIALIVAFAIFAGGAIMGSASSETGNITGGRNEGIIFCSEKPKECAVEYSYLKLKEAQK